MSVFDRLYEKLSAEYEQFIENLKTAPPDKIIQSAYEKVFKEDILMCFEDSDPFSEQEIVALLALDSPLNALYHNWLDTDVTYMDHLHDTISAFAAHEAKLQATLGINGELQVGDWVISSPHDEYGYLLGVVAAIDKLGSPEHETENETDDVHVNFFEFDYPPARVAELEAHFSDLYGEPKEFEDLPLDDVIMAPDMLIRITELGEQEIYRLGSLLENCKAFCNTFPEASLLLSDSEVKLITRLDANLADYHEYLMGCDKQELIDTASMIAAMNDAHYYLLHNHTFDDSQIEYLLQFQNPLEVCADKWRERTEDVSDMSFSLNEVFYNRDAAEAGYALMEDADEPIKPMEISGIKPLSVDEKASIADRLAAGKEKVEAYKMQNPVPTKNKEDLSK